MAKHGYTILLFLLRLLVYLKRAVLWVFALLTKILEKIGLIYRNTLGFRIYKIGIGIHKRTTHWHLRTHGRFFAFFGTRTALQAMLLVVGFVLMIPHSVLYTKDDETTLGLPGQQTVLYELVGPGYQNFELEEIVVDLASIPQENMRSWAQGAVTVDQGSSARTNIATNQQNDYIGVSEGTQALTKPTIISGATPEQHTPSAPVMDGQKRDIINHTVKPGEVIGSIAEYYDISVATILWANNLSVRSYIRPGDTLIILPTSGVLHTVKSGDTISKISNQYGAESEKIVAYNDLGAGGAAISVGQKLVIPGGEQVATVSPTLASKTTQARKYTALENVAAPPPSVAAPAGSGYLWPTTVRRITQYYGLRHTGVDIAGPVGSPLIASKSGTVVRSQCGWNGGYGCYIILDHGNGVQTLYAHSSQLYVSVGERVTQGQTIALMGSTGRSTGPHIHFEVRVNGSRQNPFEYVK